MQAGLNRVGSLSRIIHWKPTMAMSYAAAAGSASSSVPPPPPHEVATASQESTSTSSPRPRRSPSPSHRPRTDGSSDDEDVYVLTLLTSSDHHARMTALRKRYFPPRINKLEAHLTLFHALPSSKLKSSIFPVLERVAASTAAFPVRATKPFRLRRGIAISVAKDEGGHDAQKVHRALQKPWAEEGWLSEQDSGGCRVHYTIMNKVDEEAKVEEAFEEVSRNFKEDRGMAEGLALFGYEKGWWKFERKFPFRGGDGT